MKDKYGKQDSREPFEIMPYLPYKTRSHMNPSPVVDKHGWMDHCCILCSWHK